MKTVANELKVVRTFVLVASLVAMAIDSARLNAADGKQSRVDIYGDPLPDGAIGRLGTSRLQHEGRVNALAFSPDGKWLASAGREPIVRLWDSHTGKEWLSLNGHQGPVSRLSFVPGGEGKPAQVLITGGSDATIRFWDLNSGKQTRALDHPGEPTALAVSPDGKILASAGRNSDQRRIARDGKLVRPTTNTDSHIFLWNIEDGKEVRRWKAHEGGVLGLAFEPDGKSIASAGAAIRESPPAKEGDPADDHVVALWESDAGKLRRTFGQNALVAWAVAFSADGKILASPTVNKAGRRSLFLWDPKTGQQHPTLVGPINLVDPRCLALTRDSKNLAVGDLSRIMLYDTDVRGERSSLPNIFTDHVQALAFSPDGLTLASGGEKGRIILWDVRQRKALLDSGGHTQPINSVAVAPDGKTIVTTAYAEPPWLWDRATCKPQGQLKQQDKPRVGLAWCAEFSPDGRTIALAHQRDGITFWDFKTRQLQRQIPSQNLDRDINLAFSPDGKLLASESSDQPHTSLWDTTTGKLVHTYPHGTNGGSSATISPDNRLLASIGNRGALNVWDLDGNKSTFVKIDANATSAAFSPGGLLVATVGIEAKVFDAVTGAELIKFQCHFNSGTRKGIAFSPDGRLLAYADTKRISLCDMAARRELHRFEGHRGPISSLAFTPDGKALVSGSEDGTALIWDLEDVMPPFKDSHPKPTWEDLQSGDRLRAYGAFCRLHASPDLALTLLRKHLKPAEAVSAERLAELIKNLDANSFDTRQQAHQELERYGPAAEKALREAGANKPSLEARRHIDKLLAGLDSNSDWVKTLTALKLLEELRSHEARKLLESLSKGDPDFRMTREAKIALDRFGQRD